MSNSVSTPRIRCFYSNIRLCLAVGFQGVNLIYRQELVKFEAGQLKIMAFFAQAHLNPLSRVQHGRGSK